MPDFHDDEAKKLNGRLKKNLSFSKPPLLNIVSRKFQRLVLGCLALNDVRCIDVAQPICLLGCLTLAQKQAENAFLVFLVCF